MVNLSQVFKRSRNILIGAAHFPPLLGYAATPGLRVAEKIVAADAQAFVRGGMDGVIIENNYDLPHTQFVHPETVASMAMLGTRIRASVRKPLGVNVLWNDYRAAFALAVALDLAFIRIPVFVDRVRTSCGIINGDPRAVARYRKLLHAENVAVLADIHVKHAKLLSRHTLQQSARLAFRKGADAIVVTGRWTGEAPELQTLKDLRKQLGTSRYILVGSGVDVRNAKDLMRYANGAIVSTSLKAGSAGTHGVNVKNWNQRISVQKVRALRRRVL